MRHSAIGLHERSSVSKRWYKMNKNLNGNWHNHKLSVDSFQKTPHSTICNLWASLPGVYWMKFIAKSTVDPSKGSMFWCEFESIPSQPNNKYPNVTSIVRIRMRSYTQIHRHADIQTQRYTDRVRQRQRNSLSTEKIDRGRDKKPHREIYDFCRFCLVEGSFMYS